MNQCPIIIIMLVEVHCKIEYSYNFLKCTRSAAQIELTELPSPIDEHKAKSNDYHTSESYLGGKYNY